MTDITETGAMSRATLEQLALEAEGLESRIQQAAGWIALDGATETELEHLGTLSDVTRRIGQAITEMSGSTNALSEFARDNTGQRNGLGPDAASNQLHSGDASAIGAIDTEREWEEIVTTDPIKVLAAQLLERASISLDGDMTSMFEAALRAIINPKRLEQRSVHIRSIVYEYAGGVKLSSDDYKYFLTDLNALVEAGLLTHKKGTPYYDLGLVSEETKEGAVESKQDDKVNADFKSTTAATSRRGVGSQTDSQKALPVAIDSGGGAHAASLSRNASTTTDGQREPGPTEAIELSDVELSVLAHFRKVGAFRIPDLRKHVPIITDMPEEEYAVFKKMIGDLLERIKLYHESLGYSARWISMSKGKWKYYDLKLVTGEGASKLIPSGASVQEGSSAATVSNDKNTAATITSSADVPAPIQVAERDEAAEDLLMKRIETAIAKRMANLKLGHLKAKETIEFTASYLNISPDLAQTLVSALIEHGRLFKGSKRGMTVIALQEFTRDQRTSEEKRGEAKQQHDEDALTAEQIKVAVEIIDFLTPSDRHFQKAESLKVIMNSLNSKIPEKDFKRVLRMLECRGYLKIKNQAKNGIARKGPVVYVSSQDIKERWRAQKSDLVDKFKQPFVKKQPAD